MAPEEKMSPELLSRYELEGEIGEGTYGHVKVICTTYFLAEFRSQSVEPFGAKRSWLRFPLLSKSGGEP